MSFRREPVPAAAPDPSSIDALLAELTVEEKIALLSGLDTWRTVPLARLDLGSVKVSDGPNGVRGDGTSGVAAVCLPSGISMAASFDRDLVHELGGLLGRETARRGAQVLLAPTINLARHPLGGRNFETFGEEPHLAAPLTEAYVTGVQETGVGACAKHLVGNDTEVNRLEVSVEIDVATLREVYLVPFERAVAAGVWTIMAAYPRLNGVHCAENRWLLTTLLREEWGFDGLVMSDWGATTGPLGIEAGLDLEMPGPARALGPALRAALDEGRGAAPQPASRIVRSVMDGLTSESVDRAARAVLALAGRAGRIGPDAAEEAPERSVDDGAERELVRRAAAAGMVLLTNRPDRDGGVPVLPLAPRPASLALIGPNADPGVIQGGGSASLTPLRPVSPLEGIRAAMPETSIEHRVGCLIDRWLPRVAPAAWVADPTPGLGADGPDSPDGPNGAVGPLTVEVYHGPEAAGEPAVRTRADEAFAFTNGGNPDLPDATRFFQRWTGTLPIAETGVHRFGVLSVGRSRVLIDGIEVADNWTDPRPGQAFFASASEEVVGEIALAAGSEVEVVVEWSSGEDPLVEGLRFGWRPPVDEDRLLDEAVAAAAEADVAVVVVGLNADWETESHDRDAYGLAGRQDELVRRVVEVNPRTVVVLNAGGPVDLPWLDDVPATLVAWYPGQEFGSALADVLTGARDPGGRLPVTFPDSIDVCPTAGIVPGDGEVLSYQEGLFIGHRWYEWYGGPPRLPFGHGLSYADFELGPPTLTGTPGPVVTGAPGRTVADVDPFVLSVPVANRSDRSGTCVVQVYLRPADPVRPRVLAGFASASVAAGATVDVELDIDPMALRGWDGDADEWRAIGGSHLLEVGRSSVDIDHRVVLELPEPA